MCERCRNWNYSYSTMNHVNEKKERTNSMEAIVGKYVKINRGGPDSIEGKVLAVRSDYLVVQTNNGVKYVATAHIKSFSETNNSKANATQGNKSQGNATQGNRSRNRSRSNRSQGRDREYYPSTFNGVIRSFNQKFVQLNTGGPEKVTGFVAEVDNDTVMLVNNRELMRIPIYHIRSIAAESSNNNKSGNNQNKNNKSGNNQNKNNKSGGNQNKSGNKSGGKNKARASSFKMSSRTREG